MQSEQIECCSLTEARPRITLTQGRTQMTRLPRSRTKGAHPPNFLENLAPISAKHLQIASDVQLRACPPGSDGIIAGERFPGMSSPPVKFREGLVERRQGENTRPFICDGSPLRCRLFIVGLNAATILKRPFLDFWSDGGGLDRDAFMMEYLPHAKRAGRGAE
jgi:hypothetical protein